MSKKTQCNDPNIFHVLFLFCTLRVRVIKVTCNLHENNHHGLCPLDNVSLAGVTTHAHFIIIDLKLNTNLLNMNGIKK
jgi:hypothetical protein